MTDEERQQIAAQAEFLRGLNQIAEVGQARHGAKAYDEASEVVAQALGDRKFNTMAALSQLDFPDRVVVELANDERRLKEFAKLDPARQLVEGARIESQWNPHGRPGVTGAKRAWQTEAARSGRVSDDEWKAGAGHLTDEQWNKEFNRRQRERRR